MGIAYELKNLIDGLDEDKFSKDVVTCNLVLEVLKVHQYQLDDLVLNKLCELGFILDGFSLFGHSFKSNNLSLTIIGEQYDLRSKVTHNYLTGRLTANNYNEFIEDVKFLELKERNSHGY